jgi:osmotically-inducible protein OsmY
MVTTRTFDLLRELRSKFHSAYELDRHERPLPAGERFAQSLVEGRRVCPLSVHEEECMKSRISLLGLSAALLSASLFAACQNTARGVEQDTERNTAEARQEAREANAEAKQEAREANAELKQEAREAGNAVERAGDRAAQETKDATHSVGATLDAAAQTMQIKTALIDADNLDANDIDVDTNGANKTVTLKGHVPTAAQKAAAERIAKEKAPDYRVVNNIVVR